MAPKRSGGSSDICVTCPTATRPPQPNSSVLRQTYSICMPCVVSARSRCMSISTSKSRAMAKMRSIWPRGSAVEIGRGADRACAPAQALDQQFLGAGIIGEPLLRKDAEFDIDRPGVIARKLLDRLEPDHADARIEFDMGAHMHGALRDAALQRPLAARVNVLDREIALGRGGLPDGFGDGALLDHATVHDAGLVEMDMRLDQAGDHQAIARHPVPARPPAGRAPWRQSRSPGCRYRRHAVRRPERRGRYE